MEDTTLEQWSLFFDGIISLLEEAERQYGFANQQYTDYVLERMQLSINSCRSLKALMESTLGIELQNYTESLQELLGYLVFIRHKWWISWTHGTVNMLTKSKLYREEEEEGLLLMFPKSSWSTSSRYLSLILILRHCLVFQELLFIGRKGSVKYDNRTLV